MKHHNSYHGKCTVYNLCHVNAKVIISLQIKTLPQKKKSSMCFFHSHPAVQWNEHFLTQVRNVPATYICLSRTAVQPIYVNNSREID